MSDVIPRTIQSPTIVIAMTAAGRVSRRIGPPTPFNRAGRSREQARVQNRNAGRVNETVSGRTRARRDAMRTIVGKRLCDVG
jgi:hypothetical protein